MTGCMVRLADGRIAFCYAINRFPANYGIRSRRQRARVEFADEDGLVIAGKCVVLKSWYIAKGDLSRIFSWCGKWFVWVRGFGIDGPHENAVEAGRMLEQSTP